MLLCFFGFLVVLSTGQSATSENLGSHGFFPGGVILFSDASTGNTALSPLRAAWEHAKKSMKGKQRGEIVKETPSLLEVQIKPASEEILYLFTLEEVRGNTAKVLAGLKDAGVDTIYLLKKKGGTWVVVGVEETEF